MSGIFISYAREDEATAVDVENRLKKLGIVVFRDKSSIYSGDSWPDALGKGIVEHEIFLLLWSRHSAESKYLNREWNIAWTSEKRIIPVFLDETPLPPSLRAFNGIYLEDIEKDIEKIIVLTGPEKFSQSAGDKKNRLKQAKGVVFWVISLLSLAWLVWFVPWEGANKTGEFHGEVPGASVETHTIHGTVVYADNGKPAVGVKLTLKDSPNHFSITASNGGFIFENVPGAVGDRVRICVYKNGWKYPDRDVVLGKPAKICL